MKILDEMEARALLASFVATRRSEVPSDIPLLDVLQLRQTREGKWWAVRPERPHPDNEPPIEGVLVQETGCALIVGALGKLSPILGDPLTSEKHLGSTWLGRYQEFERGIAIWEVLASEGINMPPAADWARPSYFGEPLKHFSAAHALIAFFDLRGFTKWSEEPETDSAKIQAVVAGLERAFQAAFPVTEKFFVKGTGDGLMVVWETEHPPPRERTIFFCKRCARTVRGAREALDTLGLQKLAVGCGVTSGPVNRVFVLGRFDYIGEPVNRASKLQAFTFDELCIAEEVATTVRADPGSLGHRIAGKHRRVSVEEVEAL